MILINKTLRFILCSFIASLSLSSVLEAYPYAYRRLVLEKNGKIEKVVELISDLPIPEVPMVNPGKFDLLTTIKTIVDELKGELAESNKKLSDKELTELICAKFFGMVKMGKSEKSLAAALHALDGFVENKVEFFCSKAQWLFPVLDKYAECSDKASNKAYESMISFYISNVLSEKNSNSKNRGLVFSDIATDWEIADSPETIARRIVDSEHRHIIVYKSGPFCKNLSAQLAQENRFKLETSIGIENDGKLETWRFGLKAFHHFPLIAAYKFMKASERVDKKLNSLDEAARKEEENKTMNMMIDKISNPKSKVKLDKDYEIILDAFVKLIRAALIIHQDVTKMMPPLPPKTWKHLGA